MDAIIDKGIQYMIVLDPIVMQVNLAETVKSYLGSALILITFTKDEAKRLQ